MASYKHELRTNEQIRLSSSGGRVTLTLYRNGEYADALTIEGELELRVSPQPVLDSGARTVIEVDFKKKARIK